MRQAIWGTHLSSESQQILLGIVYPHPRYQGEKITRKNILKSGHNSQRFQLSIFTKIDHETKNI